MQCPKCRSEVLDWHYYCQVCNELVNDPDPHAGKKNQGMVERVGERLLNILMMLFIGALLVLMARAIRWGDLLAAIKEEAGIISDVEQEQSPRPNSTPARLANLSNPSAPKESAGKSAKVESVRALPQKIEELPAPNKAPELPVPELPPVTKEPMRDEKVVITSAPPWVNNSTLQSVGLRRINEAAILGIEQIESKHGAEVGYVEINSYTPARIYVDGQFSGLTPRTVKLSIGDHQIRLIADGYEDWTRRVSLKSLQQIGIMASMKKKADQ